MAIIELGLIKCPHCGELFNEAMVCCPYCQAINTKRVINISHEMMA